MNALTLQHLGMESSTCSGMGGISVGVDWPGEHEGAGALDKGKGWVVEEEGDIVDGDRTDGGSGWDTGEGEGEGERGGEDDGDGPVIEY